MSELKRYTIVMATKEPWKRPDGDWCKYEDVKTQLSEAKRDTDVFKAEWEDISEVARVLHLRVEKLEGNLKKLNAHYCRLIEVLHKNGIDGEEIIKTPVQEPDSTDREKCKECGGSGVYDDGQICDVCPRCWGKCYEPA